MSTVAKNWSTRVWRIVRGFSDSHRPETNKKLHLASRLLCVPLHRYTRQNSTAVSEFSLFVDANSFFSVTVQRGFLFTWIGVFSVGQKLISGQFWRLPNIHILSYESKLDATEKRIEFDATNKIELGATWNWTLKEKLVAHTSWSESMNQTDEIRNKTETIFVTFCSSVPFARCKLKQPPI